MRRVLVTGANSYVGTNVEAWLNKEPQQFEVTTIDMMDKSWRMHDFSQYDVVFHVAGIAHADVGKVSEEQKNLYYEVNTELAIETATKAREEGVGQFVFMSSMIIYGDSAPIGKKKIITMETIPKPANFYGDSKLQADLAIQGLETDLFKVVILRPPMIYGKGSKGNYPLLSKMSRRIPFFPKIENARSMLYVENLCEFVRMMIVNEERGVFFPQNDAYTQTSELVRTIAKVSGQKVWITPIFNWAIYVGAHIPGKISGIINKVFGNLVYEKSMSDYGDNTYRIYGFFESVKKTEQ